MKATACSLYSRICYSALKSVLDDWDYPYVVIKGEPLSRMLYGHFGQRNSADIDILMPRMYVPLFCERMAEMGYAAAEVTRPDLLCALLYSHQVMVRKKRVGLADVRIDVNYDIFWGEYEGTRVNIESFIEDRVPLDVYGTRVFTLSRSKALIQLYLHQYREMNSLFHLTYHNPINPVSLTEAAMLLEVLNSVERDDVIRFSRKNAINSYLWCVAAYAGVVYESDVLSLFANELYTAKCASLLDSYGLSNAERRRWDIPIDVRISKADLKPHLKLAKRDVIKIEREKRIFGGVILH